MRFSYFDNSTITPAKIQSRVKKLDAYERKVDAVVSKGNNKKPEYALAHTAHSTVVADAIKLKKECKDIKHLVLVGIGGSSLGVEAVHQALGSQGVELTVLDTVASYKIEETLRNLKKYKKHKQIGVCVVSKSGKTTETVVNANVILTALEAQFGKKIYTQTVFVGDAKSDVVSFSKRNKAKTYHIPSAVGGRYSVATEAGLIPLAMLQHDVEALAEGLQAANSPEFTSITKESAARLATYIASGYKHYVFFAFESRLEKVGAWYRQLFAESLGKEKDKKGKVLKNGMLPSVVTPVELHSVGQLFLSGFPGVYTDFVTFDDEKDFSLAKKGLGKAYAKSSVSEVATALYGGVVAAYHSKELPHRSVIFDDELPYSVGLLLGMRMREIMYVAHLIEVNAFNQPNVELYKKNTKKILGL